jgi:hypothetical protein
VFISKGGGICPGGRSEGGAFMSEERDTIVDCIDGLERRVNSRDCRVIVRLVVGACSDRRTSGASSIRMIFWIGGADNWEELVHVREDIASSITVCVCETSVDMSLKILEGVGCGACEGAAFDTEAPSAGLGALGEPGACLRGMGLRPGMVMLGVEASRIGEDCDFGACGSTEYRPVNPSTNASLLFRDSCARSMLCFPSAKSYKKPFLPPKKLSKFSSHTAALRPSNFQKSQSLIQLTRITA